MKATLYALVLLSAATLLLYPNHALAETPDQLVLLDEAIASIHSGSLASPHLKTSPEVGLSTYRETPVGLLKLVNSKGLVVSIQGISNWSEDCVDSSQAAFSSGLPQPFADFAEEDETFNSLEFQGFFAKMTYRF